MSKKITAALIALAMVTPMFAAATSLGCGDTNPATGKTITCDNGNPEMVQNPWGGTNASVPHLVAGAMAVDAAGISFPCPGFFSTYCVDITGTEYYKASARAIAKATGGFGKYGYWLNH